MALQLEFQFTPVIYDGNFIDFRFLAMNLRPEDRLELSVTRDIDKYEDLAWTAAYSTWRKVVIYDRRPVFAFGATEVSGTSRVHVWGFGSVDAVHVLKPVTRYIKKLMIPEIVSRGALEAQAVSHPANKVSHRWLQFLGFSLKATIPGVGVRKEDMILFTASADDFKRNSPNAIAA